MWIRTKSSECWVNTVGSICCCHDYDMWTLLQSVHQSQQLWHDAPLNLALCLQPTATVKLWCNNYIHSFIHWTTWPAMGGCALHTTRSLAVSHAASESCVDFQLLHPRMARTATWTFPLRTVFGAITLTTWRFIITSSCKGCTIQPIIVGQQRRL